MEEKEEFDAIFMQLIIGLQSSVWMLLGKVANPITGKVEKNLESARGTIDMLMMLQVKTKGNLTKLEEDYLSNTVNQLQLNYVEESKEKK
ncbi:MAG: DUF1844 domain-containing protein [Nanoarchaeota archaeon]|nr:DUF1844 domain-containing protein [Nanoarchaeota archaeon]